MWQNNVRVWGLFALIALGPVVGWYVTSESARLWPTAREVIVRQVENGYVVEARTKNNPYPYKEYVFHDPAVVGSAVAGLLNERIPAPRWGR